MDLYEIDENKKLSYLLDTYSKAFKDRFNTVPVIDDNDQRALRRLIKAVRVDKEKLAEIVLGIFELDDDFVKKSGYKLQFIDSRANAIMTMNGKKPKATPSGLKVAVPFHCDQCGKPFMAVVPLAYDWHSKTMCDTCKGGGLGKLQ